MDGPGENSIKMQQKWQGELVSASQRILTL